jgi:hypothetical protein
MKKLSTLCIGLLLILITSAMSCKKNKKTTTASDPPPTPKETELITTLRVYIWDSITNSTIAGSPFTFKDLDGDGAQVGVFLNNGLDSVINLLANKVYKTKVVILDETKSPTDSISNVVAGDESFEHLFFYNGDPNNSSNTSGNTILNQNYPNYTVKLNGSNITLRYIDSDNGASKNKTTRNIGLETYLRTSSLTVLKYPFITSLRHQPAGARNGY